MNVLAPRASLSTGRPVGNEVAPHAAGPQDAPAGSASQRNDRQFPSIFKHLQSDEGHHGDGDSSDSAPHDSGSRRSSSSGESSASKKRKNAVESAPGYASPASATTSSTPLSKDWTAIANLNIALQAGPAGKEGIEDGADDASGDERLAVLPAAAKDEAEEKPGTAAPNGQQPVPGDPAIAIPLFGLTATPQQHVRKAQAGGEPAGPAGASEIAARKPQLRGTALPQAELTAGQNGSGSKEILTAATSGLEAPTDGQSPVAFEARLESISASPAASHSEPATVPTGVPKLVDTAAPPLVVQAQNSGGNAHGAEHGDTAQELPQEKLRKPQHQETAEAVTPARAESNLTAHAATAVESPAPASTRSAHKAEAPAETQRAETPVLKEPPRPAGSTVRDIEFQMNGGDQRVQVRLVERAGQVHVDVRTPDSRLAGDLRSDLPTLTQKLEQAGFRAETWHPGADSTSKRQEIPTTSASHQSESDPQNGRGQQHQQQERQDRPKPQQYTPGAKKESRKEFAWLLSALR